MDAKCLQRQISDEAKQKRLRRPSDAEAALTVKYKPFISEQAYKVLYFKQKRLRRPSDTESALTVKYKPFIS
jgi:hypothetical protein